MTIYLKAKFRPGNGKGVLDGTYPHTKLKVESTVVIINP